MGPLSGRTAGRLVLCVVVASVLCGCDAQINAEGSPTAGSSKRSESPTADAAHSQSPAQAARRQATGAYIGMWRNTAEAGKTSDWRSPKLSEYATGDALSVLSRGMYADHYNGLISKGKPKNDPKVTSVDPTKRPTTVMISDCGDSTHWLQYRKKTGKLADDKPGGRRLITAEVKKQANGSWKVTRFAVEEIGSC